MADQGQKRVRVAILHVLHMQHPLSPHPPSHIPGNQDTGRGMGIIELQIGTTTRLLHESAGPSLVEDSLTPLFYILGGDQQPASGVLRTSAQRQQTTTTGARNVLSCRLVASHNRAHHHSRTLGRALASAWSEPARDVTEEATKEFSFLAVSGFSRPYWLKLRSSYLL
jgi:hypothetical protein